MDIKYQDYSGGHDPVHDPRMAMCSGWPIAIIVGLIVWGLIVWTVAGIYGY